MSKRRRQTTAKTAGGLLALALAGFAGPAVGANSLATPITSELQQPLWPLEVGVQIVTADDEAAEHAPIEAMPFRSVTVPDGQPVSFASGIWTPRGRLDFTVAVAAHQHPREQVEVEWDLIVEDAPYEQVSVGDYLLHRLRFGPRPDVGPKRVRASRADIVAVRGEPHVQSVEIDGQKYEIRIFALSVRG